MARSKRDRQDPTRQARRRAQAAKRIDNRLLASQRVILTRWRAVPFSRRTVPVIVNQEITTVYDYDLTPEQLQAMLAEFTALINAELDVAGEQPPPDWWWRDQVEPPYRQGAAEETVQFNQLIAAALAAGALSRFGTPPQPVPVELTLTTPSYREGLRREVNAGFLSLKNLASGTAAQISRVVGAGISAGLSPTAISQQIVERFDVAQSSAERIANTEVNRAYNNAKMDATKAQAAQTGLQAGVIHISALLPTTRSWHADRHGNAYTVEDQREWWDTGANRISCHCSTRPVLVDIDGRVVNTELQDELRSEVAD